MKNKLYIFSLSILCVLQFNCDYDVVPDLVANPCNQVLCLNGGTCIDGVCDCKDGFGGNNCETIVVDPCDTPINGCTDATACNYNENANCDDGSCNFGNSSCPDPCNQPNPDDGCDITADSYNEVTCSVINQPNCPNGTTFNVNTCNCDDVVIEGCTDKCAPNFNPMANTNDGSCQSYSTTCNTDCSLGDIEVWDSATCNCIISIVRVLGCTTPAACNYDASANCDDRSCNYGNTACPDACNEPNPNDGCDITTDSFDTSNCEVINTPNCPANTTFNANTCSCDINIIMGCTDPCAPNYNVDAEEDDASCQQYNKTCNQDCTVGPFGGSWDAASCACINETTPNMGCTARSADNYNPTANCDDGSCSFICSEIVCDNGGTCINGECYCLDGFTGDRCELEENSCEPLPLTPDFFGNWKGQYDCANYLDSDFYSATINPLIEGIEVYNFFGRGATYNASLTCEDDVQKLIIPLTATSPNYSFKATGSISSNLTTILWSTTEAVIENGNITTTQCSHTWTKR